jgi:hypothetical protein
LSSTRSFCSAAATLNESNATSRLVIAATAGIQHLSFAGRQQNKELDSGFRRNDEQKRSRATPHIR